MTALLMVLHPPRQCGYCQTQPGSIRRQVWDRCKIGRSWCKVLHKLHKLFHMSTPRKGC